MKTWLKAIESPSANISCAAGRSWKFNFLEPDLYSIVSTLQSRGVEFTVRKLTIKGFSLRCVWPLKLHKLTMHILVVLNS